MNIKQAKTIKIEILLSKYGYKPSRQNPREIWYISPLRSESTASFKVNTTLNTRYDFGLSKGGDVIKFICDLKNTDIKGALNILDSASWGVSQIPAPQMTINTIEPKRGLQLLSAGKIQYFPLIEYLKGRFIARSVWEKYLTQVEYLAPNDRKYTAIGFKNDAGDYEIRNKYFKGFVGTTKTITSLNLENAKTILVFEGFFDFLAFQSSPKDTTLNCGYIVLNGVYGQDTAIEKINEGAPSHVQLFLDNDEAGEGAFRKISQAITVENISNCSHMYEGYKDFSEMWQKYNSL